MSVLYVVVNCVCAVWIDITVPCNHVVDLIPPEENVKEFADAEDHLEDSELM